MIPFQRYLPIDDDTFESPLFLTSGGIATIAAGESYPSQRHPQLYQFDWNEGRVLPEFSLLLIEAGSGVWETSAGAFPIREGQVGQVFSGEWHRYRPDPASGWTECWLQFNGRLVHDLKAAGYFSPEQPVKTPESGLGFRRQFLELLEEVRSTDFTNSPAQGMRVAGLLGLMMCRKEPVYSKGQSLVEKALEHIWSYSHRQMGVPEVAAQLGVSRRTLERAFQAERRVGVLEEITRCRLNRAERLLRETHLPLKHVVTLAGFGTAEQMRLQFQSRYGVSPSSYRERGATGS